MFEIIGQWACAYLALGVIAAAVLALHDNSWRRDPDINLPIVFTLDVLIWPLALWAEFGADDDDFGGRA